MSRKTGKEVAETVSDFVNVAFESEKEEFVKTVVTDHKTLQEDMFGMFLGCINEWSEMAKQGNYDARNEYTCRMSKIMINALKEKGFY